MSFLSNNSINSTNKFVEWLQQEEAHSQLLADAVDASRPIVMDIELLAVRDDLLDRGDYDDGDQADLEKALELEANRPGPEV